MVATGSASVLYTGAQQALVPYVRTVFHGVLYPPNVQVPQDPLVCRHRRGGGYSTMGFSMLTTESVEFVVFNEFPTLENVGLDINMLSIESFFISNDSKHPVMSTVVLVDCCIEILPFLSLSIILY